jgi:hypothetical protein
MRRVVFAQMISGFLIQRIVLHHSTSAATAAVKEIASRAATANHRYIPMTIIADNATESASRVCVSCQHFEMYCQDQQ